MKKRLAWLLTWSRMGLSVPIVILIGHGSKWAQAAAAALFILASVTDYADGYVARRWNQVSDWGKIFDPIADKILVTSVLMALVPTGQVPWVLPVLFVSRDLIVGGWRSLAASQGVVIAAKPSGKWKTAIQMIAIPALLLEQMLPDWPLRPLGLILLWLSVMFSLTSAWEYYQLKKQMHKP